MKPKNKLDYEKGGSSYLRIEGLFETHLNVADLDRSIEFYKNVLGLELSIYEAERRAAFFWIGGRGKAMLGLWEKSPDKILPQHFAFSCSEEDVISKALDFLSKRNLPYYNFLEEEGGDPLVHAWMPAISIYFKDPDDHELEFIAMLQGKPRPDLGIITYEEWKTINRNSSK